jgi:hypothetical protein
MSDKLKKTILILINKVLRNNINNMVEIDKLVFHKILINQTVNIFN